MLSVLLGMSSLNLVQEEAVRFVFSTNMFMSLPVQSALFPSTLIVPLLSSTAHMKMLSIIRTALCVEFCLHRNYTVSQKSSHL